MTSISDHIFWSFSSRAAAMYSWAEIQWASLILACLPAVLISALAASLSRDRLTFVAGLVGIVIGCLWTEYFFYRGRLYGGWSHDLSIKAESTRADSIFCALVSMVIYLLAEMAWNKRSSNTAKAATVDRDLPHAA